MRSDAEFSGSTDSAKISRRREQPWAIRCRTNNLGVKHLVAQGIADPKRVGIMGGSYGLCDFGWRHIHAGFVCGGGRHRRAFKSEYASRFDSALLGANPTAFYKRMGEPNTPEGKAQLERQSPLNHVVNQNALMIVQAQMIRVWKKPKPTRLSSLCVREIIRGSIFLPETKDTDFSVRSIIWRCLRRAKNPGEISPRTLSGIDDRRSCQTPDE